MLSGRTCIRQISRPPSPRYWACLTLALGIGEGADYAAAHGGRVTISGLTHCHTPADPALWCRRFYSLFHLASR